MEEILKKNIKRCRECPFREPGCRKDCFTGIEIDKRQKAIKEQIKKERNKDNEYYGLSKARDTKIIREHRR